jgi:hypothetical protein
MRSRSRNSFNPALGSPVAGSGSGCMPLARQKRAEGSSTTRQPLSSISTARQ